MTLPALPPFVITGASGFVGRRLLAALAGLGHPHVVVLARRPELATSMLPWSPTWRAVACDLARDDVPRDAIGRDDTVLHLAAATGTSAPAVMQAVNVEGTRRLVRATQDAGGGHLILISSIAARYRDRRWYPYADSKRAAEMIVADSGVPCSIVRPTMVIGEGSVVGEGLARLATGGAPIVLGRGDVRVQPVHVDDLVAFLLALAAHGPAGVTPLEVGGADRLAMRELLGTIRAARGLPRRRVVPVPLGALRASLALLEPVARPVLPVTAGQLAAFVNDSDAGENAIVQALLPAPMGVREMFSRGRSHG